MVASESRIASRRAALRRPPPGMHNMRIRSAALKATQNPMKGPKEKAKKTRSRGVVFAASNTRIQFTVIHSQDSGVSSQRSGRPVVALVCEYRVYRSRG